MAMSPFAPERDCRRSRATPRRVTPGSSEDKEALIRRTGAIDAALRSPPVGIDSRPSLAPLGAALLIHAHTQAIANVKSSVNCVRRLKHASRDHVLVEPLGGVCVQGVFRAR